MPGHHRYATHQSASQGYCTADLPSTLADDCASITSHSLARGIAQRYYYRVMAPGVTLACLVQMLLGALAALAVAGVAAGSLYMRQHLTGRKPESSGAAKDGDEGQRKDLRRKRGYMLLKTPLAAFLPCT